MKKLFSIRNWRQWVDESLPENEEVDDTYFATILDNESHNTQPLTQQSPQAGTSQNPNDNPATAPGTEQTEAQFYIRTHRGVEVSCRDLMLAPKPINRALRQQSMQLLDTRTQNQNQLDLSTETKSAKVADISPHVLDLNS